ncbi:uncharacterized protein BP01DRAFT_383748 [Aspergillus saccharolyticus JOP 1030-1]|uniref:Uncharacterized protein n=1 Tax=Aspergillus saccharolyticus JOP 1030-1 TaxID=1450539 RepID=A0A318ZVV0_9EURO|nr:hypothetical protein BP01DRAFT_383748 [Aspergillus saccharolyticus JOP 1030-1]PYH44258.1 hypothetical protein BP01DRAFT_383748 [Aspergillus saccharolyticus JOP 1030-1]
MSRRRASHSEPMGLSSAMNEAFAYPFSGTQQNNAPPRRGPIEGPNGRRLIRRVTWRSSTYKLMACLWVLGVFYIVWLIRDIFYLPFTPSPKGPIHPESQTDLLAHYVGRRECGISSQSLYNTPSTGDGRASHPLYCSTRDALLSAMSNGGRHGFDAAYTSQGNLEVCEILHRFDGVIFVGDDALADAYAGFNILLRENLATGSLKDWDMDKDLRQQCRCESQFTQAACLPLRITSSEEVYAQNGGPAMRTPYSCPSRVSHAFLPADGSTASKSTHDHFRRLTGRATDRSKPVPVILSLSLATSYSLPAAQKSMDEWMSMAKATKHSTPFLWVGPTAPGLRKDARDNIYASSWQYSQETIKEARARGMDALGVYNATLQADSWDGKHYGEQVALVQAMMIVNWLSTL